MAEYAMGMIGLGVMGRNLSFNMEEKGFSVAAYDAWPDPVDRFVEEGKGKNVGGFKDVGELVRSLRKPRRIILLIKAGDVTDKGIQSLLPHLEPGDMIVDGGNEFYKLTERRAGELAEKHIKYFGMGVSGGEEGARHGPSLMPGGDKEAYEELKPVFTKIAAQVADGPCVTYCGPGGAGHYVKMVHNGIEYGDMQLIAESYALLKNLGGLTNTELADTFDAWNHTELESFLIEITAKIFRTKDPEGPGDLLDAVLDATAQKGTGKWTVQDAADVGSAIPTIATSVEARLLSSRQKQRVEFSKILSGPQPQALTGDAKKQLIEDVRAALYASKACSYAQGFDLLKNASDQRNWGVKLSEFARIWQGGCIIRAKFLSRLKEAYERNNDLSNLLIDGAWVDELAQRQTAWRRVIAQAAQAGVPLLTMGASLGYYDTIRTARLPANLTQAQRDMFGAHTYKRLDKDGDFHSKWALGFGPISHELNEPAGLVIRPAERASATAHRTHAVTVDPNETWPAELWLLRHGESAANVARRAAEAAGHLDIGIAARDVDVELSPLGSQQARAVGRWFRERSEDARPEVVLASPYVRAAQTASIVVEEARIARGSLVYVVDERLREKEFGALERLTKAGIAARLPHEAEQRDRLGKFYYRPPGGESWCDVILRLRSVLHHLQLRHAGKRVLVVAHEVIVLCFRYLLEEMSESQILRINEEIELANCSLTSYVLATDVRGAKMKLDRYNFVAPLEDAGAEVTKAPDVTAFAR